MGRLALLSEVRHLLGQGVSVALSGPSGIGRSALLDALESGAEATVLRANGAASEQAMPYAALQDLIDQVPAQLVADLPEPVRVHLDNGLVGAPASDELTCSLSRAFRSLLDTLAAQGPVLLLLDDAQWLDPDSACVVGYARRRLAGRVGVVASIGPGAGTDADLSGLRLIEVSPLEAGDMIDLLGAHGLPAHVAQRLHLECGGVPALALALCGAVGARPSLLGRPTPVPSSIEHVLRERFLAQPEGVRNTLGYAALLYRPTIRHLERAGQSGTSTYKPSTSGFSAAVGTIKGCLTGPTGVDLDLYLQRFNGSAWADVAAIEGATSTETITYTATAGSYRWDVYAYAGSGSFTLKYDVP